MNELSPDVKASLAERFTAVNDDTWVRQLATKLGWAAANRRYLASARERGLTEMTALMDAAGVRRPAAPDDALRLIELAVTLYAPGAEVERADDRSLHIAVRDCPTYRRIEEAGWHGVTACGTWHRRRGWYQALGIRAEDTLTGEKKWGDVACAATVTVEARALTRAP